MAQLGFFDADKRLETLSARGDPLEAIDHLVPWESFRAAIEAVCCPRIEGTNRLRFEWRIRTRQAIFLAIGNSCFEPRRGAKQI